MGYSQISGPAGQLQQALFFQIDTTQREILGTVIACVDNYLGFAEFKYVQFPASAAIPAGSVVVESGFGGTAGHSAAIAPVTANTGKAIGVCFNAVASNAAIQYGWIQISGAALVKCTASVAAGSPVGIDVTTPGSVAALSAGRQIMGAQSLAPSTTTVVYTANLTNASPKITLSKVDGVFPGLAVSGTGVSGTVSTLDPNSRDVYLSANNTAAGSSTVTFTYTGFIVMQLNRCNLQGAIT
jgi:hypothetical protein